MAPRGMRAGGRGFVEILEDTDEANLSCIDKRDLMATAVKEAVVRARAGGAAAGPSTQDFDIG
eukprot:1036979-Alexandrium_andersonii.AAC.1